MLADLLTFLDSVTFSRTDDGVLLHAEKGDKKVRLLIDWVLLKNYQGDALNTILHMLQCKFEQTQ